MDFLAWIMIGELVGLAAALLFGSEHSNDTLTYMLFGVVGAIFGGRIPSIFAQGKVISEANNAVPMAVLGAVILVAVEAFLQTIRIYWQRRN